MQDTFKYIKVCYETLSALHKEAYAKLVEVESCLFMQGKEWFASDLKEYHEYVDTGNELHKARIAYFRALRKK